ncbi:MAG: lipoprotein-releasing ABC transporter permease subunit [Gammaproteobacteria bacterium]
MFRPAALFIGLRYTRAKRRNHFISFISMMSMFGIALGVLVLITVLSVMNGFDREIKSRVFSMVPPVTVSSSVDAVSNWQDVEVIMKKNPSVTAVAPFVSAQAMMTNGGLVQPVLIDGIDPVVEKNITELSSKVVQGSLNELVAGQFGIILGEELADRLNASVGDKVVVVTPQLSLTPAGVIPRAKRFTVVGIFRAGAGFGFDGGLAFIHITDGQKLMQLGSSVTGVHASIKDVYTAQRVSEQLGKTLGPSARISNWTNQFGAFFHAVSLEKTMMFYILILIIAVAVFNLVCTLVMVVNDKTADIAILRTFGATPRMIMGVFVVQGAIVGVVGTLLGIIGGVALALNVTDIVNWIERIFNVQFLSSSVYFVNYLPSELQVSDIVRISLAALIFSLFATLYPAWRASRTEPVEALRYE